MKNILWPVGWRVILVLIFSILTAPMQAQNRSATTEVKYQPLKIGDKIPDALWEMPLEVVNHSSKTIKLGDYKDKLIILDFWATWCSACLLNFPKMEELERRFVNEIKIIAVTNQNMTVLEKFYSSPIGKRYHKVSSVIGDKLLHELFPHQGVPYIVWIKDGKLLNSTDAEQVTEKSISEILDNKESSLQTVIQLERDRPLMLSEAFDREQGLNIQNYSLLARGRIRSIGFGTWFHRTEDGKVYGRQFTNLSLMEIIRTITAEIFEQREEPFNEKKIVMEVANPTLLNYIINKDGKREDYNRYSYEYIVPIAKSDSLYPMMLNNLNQFIDYSASVEKRKMKCFVLKRTSQNDKLASKGGELQYLLTTRQTALQNISVYKLISGLSSLPYMTFPIVDETNYKKNIDMKMGEINDMSTLRKELFKKDLELLEAERELDVLIIRDKLKK